MSDNPSMCVLLTRPAAVRAQRCLFGRATSSETMEFQKICDQAEENASVSFTKKFNFCPRVETPEEGPFEWEEVSLETVPSFYRNKTYSQSKCHRHKHFPGECKCNTKNSSRGSDINRGPVDIWLGGSVSCDSTTSSDANSIPAAAAAAAECDRSSSLTSSHSAPCDTSPPPQHRHTATPPLTTPPTTCNQAGTSRQIDITRYCAARKRRRSVGTARAAGQPGKSMRGGGGGGGGASPSSSSSSSSSPTHY